ncbi:MAG TPA: hypothetical protein PLN31_20610 [Azoarcus taiwanensis]|nr:hypothetical protein [Azoarcus taiwanensis]
MTTDIDQTSLHRLRESQERFEQECRNEGHQVGRIWATKFADYRELKKVAALDNVEHDVTLADLLHAADTEVGELFNDPEDVTDDHAIGFIEGAAEVFAEV